MDTISREKYEVFYKNHPDMSIYSSPWWLDAVAKDKWDVILIERSGKVVASFPYVIERTRFGKKKICMPPLTQKLGPYLEYGNIQKESKRIEFENDVFDEIIMKLPKFDIFSVNFDQKYKNWLSFCWRGFSQTTRYSYRLMNLSDIESVKGGFARLKKRLLKKSECLYIGEDMSAEDFYSFFSEEISKRREKVSFDYKLFQRVYEASYKNNQGKSYYCYDKDGKVHASAFFVWDENVAYYLVAMRKKEYASSGATERILMNFLESKYVKGKIFDFEGSMIQNVERSFREFGAVQTQYFSIEKVNNALYKIIDRVNNYVLQL